MIERRIRFAKEKQDLVRKFLSSDDGTGPPSSCRLMSSRSQRLLELHVDGVSHCLMHSQNRSGKTSSIVKATTR